MKSIGLRLSEELYLSLKRKSGKDGVSAYIRKLIERDLSLGDNVEVMSAEEVRRIVSDALSREKGLPVREISKVEPLVIPKDGKHRTTRKREPLPHDPVSIPMNPIK